MTQLLCTFSHKSDLELVIDYIQLKYQIPEKRIFIFQNDHNNVELYYTFNAMSITDRGKNTISIHRKRDSNTLYTVNAMNEVIKILNNGVLDESFVLPWDRFKNSFLLTDNELGYKQVPLRLYKQITW